IDIAAGAHISRDPELTGSGEPGAMVAVDGTWTLTLDRPIAGAGAQTLTLTQWLEPSVDAPIEVEVVAD
ncbi:MAG: hypothetical protein ACTH7O_08535, partial [Microbacterium gubbeenense]